MTDLESDTQWGRDHRNLIEAFVYSEFDMLCKDFLQKKVQELAEIAKEAILHPHATDTDDHNDSTTALINDR